MPLPTVRNIFRTVPFNDWSAWEQKSDLQSQGSTLLKGYLSSQHPYTAPSYTWMCISELPAGAVSVTPGSLSEASGPLSLWSSLRGHTSLFQSSLSLSQPPCRWGPWTATPISFSTLHSQCQHTAVPGTYLLTWIELLTNNYNIRQQGRVPWSDGEGSTCLWRQGHV